MEPQLLLNETSSGNDIIFENQIVTFTCVADGFPPPNIVWLHNGTYIFILPPPSRRSLSLDTVNSAYRAHVPTAVNSTLTVSELRLRDIGEYICRVDPFNIDRGSPVFSDVFELQVEPGNRDELVSVSGYHALIAFQLPLITAHHIRA